MKNPWELLSSLSSCPGLMEMLDSVPSSLRPSIAISSRLSLMKQNLHTPQRNCTYHTSLLPPRYPTHSEYLLVFIAEQNLVGISAVIRLSCSVVAQNCTWRTTRPSCDNTTSSTKPEVHNISQRCQTSTKPQSQVACIENSVTFGSVVFEYESRRTDKQMYMYILITIFCTPPWIEVKLTALPRPHALDSATARYTHRRASTQPIT